MISLNSTTSEFTQDPQQVRWSNFTARLRGTYLFSQVHLASEQEVDSNNISTNYQLLLFALGSSQNERDLQFAATRLVLAMGDLLTREDIDELNSLLVSFEFSFTLGGT